MSHAINMKACQHTNWYRGHVAHNDESWCYLLHGASVVQVRALDKVFYCCVAVCCSVLQCVAVCSSGLQCVAVCCSILQCIVVYCCVAVCYSVVVQVRKFDNVMYCCVAACCSVLQCVAVCYSVLQCGGTDMHVR